MFLNRKNSQTSIDTLVEITSLQAIKRNSSKRFITKKMTFNWGIIWETFNPLIIVAGWTLLFSLGIRAIRSAPGCRGAGPLSHVPGLLARKVRAANGLLCKTCGVVAQASANADECTLPSVGRFAPVCRAAERVKPRRIGIGIESEILDRRHTGIPELRGDKSR